MAYSVFCIRSSSFRFVSSSHKICASFHTSGHDSTEYDPKKLFPPITTETANLKRGTGGRSSVSGKIATVFGATGYLGTLLVNRLGKRGTQVIIPYRGDQDTVRRLKLAGDLGQILFQHYNLKDEDALYKAMKHSHIVINTIGSNFETKNFPFEEVHVKGPRNIARIARECGVETLVHVSALNACEKPKPVIIKSGSQFLASKWRGEQAVREEFPKAIIFRPSDIFGPLDKFCCYYATRKRRTFRSISLWNRGNGIIKQPVYYLDIAAGIIQAAFDPCAAGQTFQAVGPHRYELGELVDWFNRVMVKNTEDFCFRLNLRYDPIFWSKLLISEYFYSRKKLLSLERIERDSVTDAVQSDVPTLKDLGIELISMEKRIFHILKYYRSHAYLDPLQSEFVRPVEPPPFATA